MKLENYINNALVMWYALLSDKNCVKTDLLLSLIVIEIKLSAN